MPELQRFEAFYRKLLKLLDGGLNGEVDSLPMAIGVMYQLKDSTIRLMKTPIADGAETYGPPFWYVVNVPIS